LAKADSEIRFHYRHLKVTAMKVGSQTFVAMAYPELSFIENNILSEI
jgi:hypothetical protein